ncbi:transglutaminase family protein [Mesorhizobium sp. L-8-3]|uniref:transglutaminase family protein n=1 Tax=Mesorhizobium sp. L-8-3 TaxID=2744522 RepID=UPI00192883BA|nr:transglutaminase family protein [Mesorhizobium sp. L-8-3]BCH22690.1 transglutaminase [Mesorhizobium sp. L-8-3]
MLYEVRMTTTYEYGRPAANGRHLLRLMPAEIPGSQRMIAGSLDISPRPQERHDQVDFFGNRMTGLVFAQAHDEIAFTVRARMERWAVADQLDISPSLAILRSEIEAFRSLAPQSPHHFLGPSPRIAPDSAVSDYALAVTRGCNSVLDAVAAINQALHSDMRYDPEATTVETTMADAFAARHGVCQDFSHIMIACLREIGVPAGYVSGFLRTEPPQGQPRLEGADAMHAWVAAWCGTQTGWVEFDPTNAIRVSSDHIVVARGRDYSDVAPVKGVLWTAGSQTTKQVVDVIPLG